MKHSIILSLLLGMFLCGLTYGGHQSRPLYLEQMLAVQRLRKHCAACHAVGELRFIRSDDNEDVWNYIQTVKAPRSQKLWRDAIIQVINWPTGQAPDFDSVMEPATGKDWMPKGYKRIEMADDTWDGKPIRDFIIRVLESH